MKCPIARPIGSSAVWRTARSAVVTTSVVAVTVSLSRLAPVAVVGAGSLRSTPRYDALSYSPCKKVSPTGSLSGRPETSSSLFLLAPTVGQEGGR